MDVKTQGKVQVRLLCDFASPTFYWPAGSVRGFSQEEAARIVEAGSGEYIGDLGPAQEVKG